MKKDIQKSITKAMSLDEIATDVLSLFDEIKLEEKTKKLGYVSGIITSEGKDKMSQNIKRLDKFTEHVRSSYDFPIFSATDIFTDEVYSRLAEMKMEHAELHKKFVRFWRTILSGGHVTDIFMTPRWHTSRGATDEHITAQELGLKIYYIEEELS